MMKKRGIKKVKNLSLFESIVLIKQKEFSIIGKAQMILVRNSKNEKEYFLLLES